MLGLEVCVDWTMIIYKDTCKCIFCLGAPACLNVFFFFQANKWLIEWLTFCTYECAMLYLLRATSLVCSWYWWQIAEKRYPSGRRSPASHSCDPTAAASTSSSRQCVDDDETTQFTMTPETLRAVDAVKFIEAHLRTEDDYAEVWRTSNVIRSQLCRNSRIQQRFPQCLRPIFCNNSSCLSSVRLLTMRLYDPIPLLSVSSHLCCNSFIYFK